MRSLRQRSYELMGALEARPTTAFLWASVAVCFGLHALIWLKPWVRSGFALDPFFGQWDASYYAAIARSGPSAAPRAFYPLFPWITGVVTRAIGSTQFALMGAIVSLVAFAVFVQWVASAAKKDGLPTGLVPLTRSGWLLFVFGPASYAFHSMHTESLFLLFSWGSLYLSARRQPIPAGLLAAASVWTRNQGVLLSVASALLAASAERDRRLAVRSFLIVGAVSFAGWLGFLTFEHFSAGSALAFVEAQQGWSHAHSPVEVVRTLWFGNPWQSTNSANLYRYAFFWLLVVATVLVFRKQRALGFYVGASTAIFLLQGELVNSFRYGVVLFPSMFVLGDQLVRKSRWLALALLLVFVALNLLTTREYGAGRWAY